MADFFKSKAFVHRRGKIYFRRNRFGPVYEVGEAEKTALTNAANSLRKKMFILIGSFLTVFLLTVFLLPQILGLNYQMALIVVVGLLIFSFIPFFLMVKFNLSHQKKIRAILGPCEAVMLPRADKTSDPQTPKTDPRLGINTSRLVAIFLLGIAISTVGLVMLYFTVDLPFRKQFIWWLNLVTGTMLSGLGLYGLLKKKPRNPKQSKTSNDGPGDQP